ncbi:MAG: hypothetical protein VKJ64_21740 [Leptolyngbyaceae bacterium]|nr:hypothetical protein [Leptolyngbyaceae bacterium]
MTRGLYITANDKVMDHAIAFLNSLRLHDPDIPVILIPYNEDYHQVATCLNERFGVTVYEDLDFIKRISQRLYDIFGNGFFARPNQFRKQACWFGPFEEFVYIDTDIVVFEPISQNMNYLADYDFICADYQHLGGLTNVFSPKVLEAGIFTTEQVKDIFNGGFWGSKKGLITEDDLYETFQECAAHPEYFDFSQKTSDQPIINYMILKRIDKRFNIVRREGGAPGNWGGSPHFQMDENYQLYDPKLGQKLQYIHWAGIRIEPGCPYWDVWYHHRYLNEDAPGYELPKPPSLFQNIKQRLRTLVKP